MKILNAYIPAVGFFETLKNFAYLHTYTAQVIACKMNLLEVGRIKSKSGHAQSRVFFNFFFSRIECSLSMPNVSIGVNSPIETSMLFDRILFARGFGL